MAITLKEAKTLRHGDMLYHVNNRNSDGTPQRWRVNGKVKTWKTMPERIEVPLKYGLKHCDYLTQNELKYVCFTAWEASGVKITFKKHEEGGFAVVFGTTKTRGKVSDRVIGRVWKDAAKRRWYHSQSVMFSKTRAEAAIHLLNTMLE